MKFTATKEKLLEGLQQVQNVVSTRTTLPILSNVLLQASDGSVHLTTTDLDVGVRGSFEADVEKEGATTLPARRLFNIVRELPSSEIQIDVDGKNAASIRSGQSFFKILGLPEEEFPPLPKFEEAKVVTIRQKDLRDGIRKTSYAISTDETRYVLNGVLFSFKDNKLTLVATDGRRLAMVDIELEIPRSQEADIIVPTKAVTELRRRESKREQRSDCFRFSQDLAGLEADRRKLSELQTSDSGRSEGAGDAGARDIFEFAPPRFAFGEREIEFDQAELQQEQHRHHREHAGSR
jgi:DNA polymerase-3 subunit beta